MASPSIAILSGSHLCHNPRVMKEATTLAEAGYDVEVIGGWFDAKLRARDREMLPQLKFRYNPVLDLVEKSGPTRFAARLRRKLGEVGHAQGGLENTWELGYFSSALKRAVRRSNADLLIAHSEQAMAAIAGTSHRVGVDLEDWFSEEAAIENQRPAALLRSLEQSLLSRASHVSCTSKVMSQRLAATFECKPPTVIYNTFPWSERTRLDGQRKDRRDKAVPSLHWFSQTLGRARGLEELFQALPLLHRKIEIHLRGRKIGGFDSWLNEQLPHDWRSHVFVHELVANDELLSRIAEHDVGFSGESPYCANKQLTISNKVLQYLLAGLAVVASDTSGHLEVAEVATEALTIYKAGDAESLAAGLNFLLDNPEQLANAKSCALQAAEQTFCWERQAPVLTEAIRAALST